MKINFLAIVPVIIVFFIVFNCEPVTGEDDGSEWQSCVKLTAFDGEENDNFGKSVSISGDYVVIGSYHEDGEGTNRGAAYVYHRIGDNTWDIGYKLSAYDAENDDLFGYAVSISGDYVISGAPYEDGEGINEGAAYVYRHLKGNMWNSGTKLISIDPHSGSSFGCSVSISGDYAIVGAKNEWADDDTPDTGAAYIFKRNGTGDWDTGIKLTAFDAAEDDEFGNAVSICADYAVVAAKSKDGSGALMGAVYVFRRIGVNIWDAGTKITAFDARSADNFGQSVCISGNTIVIGSRYNAAGNGAVYTYVRTGVNTWENISRLVSHDTWLGISVSVSGNYVITGSGNNDGGGHLSGEAFIIERYLTETNFFPLHPFDIEDESGFGNSVSISGDYAIVGSAEKDEGGVNEGAVYIYKR